MSKLAKLTVEMDGPTPKTGTRVLLDDHDVTKCITALELKASVGDVTTARLDVVVGSVELRGEAVSLEVRDLLEGYKPRRRWWQRLTRLVRR